MLASTCAANLKPAQLGDAQMTALSKRCEFAGMKVPCRPRGPKPVPNGSTAPNRSKSPVPDDGVAIRPKRERTEPWLVSSPHRLGDRTASAQSSPSLSAVGALDTPVSRLKPISRSKTALQLRPRASEPRKPRRLPDWLPDVDSESAFLRRCSGTRQDNARLFHCTPMSTMPYSRHARLRRRGAGQRAEHRECH